jgi:hypothetical protein
MRIDLAGLETELIDSLILAHRLAGNLCPPLIGVVRGVVKGRRWQPCEHGQLLLVTGVFGDDDELIDIVASRPSQPGQWWLRTGNATILGEDHYLSRRFLGEPVLVHPTPEAWARSGGEGCVMLDADLMRLIGFTDIVVNDANLAKRIRRAHRKPPPYLPKIWLQKPDADSNDGQILEGVA